MVYQCIDDGLEFAVHDFEELVNGEADAVVGDTVLRVTSRPDS